VTAAGVEVEKPVELTTNWDIGMKPADKRGSW